MNDKLVVRGAREHNLKGVDLELAAGRAHRVFGSVGFGKVLARIRHDLRGGPATLRRVAERVCAPVPWPDGQARRRLHRGAVSRGVDRSEVDQPQPAVHGGHHHRGVRLLAPAVMRAWVCRIAPCVARQSQSQTAQQIVDSVLALPEGTRYQVLAPMVRGRKGEYADLFADLQQQGFARARVDGETIQLTDPPALEKKLKHDIEVVVDRLVARDGVRQRLADSVETALRLADGPRGHRPGRRRHPRAAVLGEARVPQRPRAQPRRDGAADLLLQRPIRRLPRVHRHRRHGLRSIPIWWCPIPRSSLAEGAIAPWEAMASDYFGRMVRALSEDMGFSMDTPFEDLPQEVKESLLVGKDYEVHVRFRNRYGRERQYTTGFEGAITWLERLHRQTESD